MRDQTDMADFPFGEGSARSPIGLGAPTLEHNCQDMKILFGNDFQI